MWFKRFISLKPFRMPRFVLLPRRLVWAEIFAMGLLIALGVIIWPTAQCRAFQGCGDARTTWCNPDCSSSCVGSTKVGYVTYCYVDSGACLENFIPEYRDVQCSNPSDCAPTNISRVWDVRGCEFDGTRRCHIQSRPSNVDCCGANSTRGGGGGCSPSYEPPTITLGSTTPRYPIVYGQDPDKLGITITVNVAGGADSNGCGGGPKTITSITLNSVTLSSASVDWITGTLSLRFPGAMVKGSYPLRPSLTITGIGTAAATATFHFDPLDPGNYDMSITAIQDDGQNVTTTLNAPAYLLDSTITLPEQ